MLLVLSLIAIAAASTLKVPGGTLDLPPGCASPGVETGPDSSLGFIECGVGKAKIGFVSLAKAPAPCDSSELVQLQAQSGHPLIMCFRKVGRGQNRPETMFVDLGVGVLLLEVKSSKDILLLLRVAASFRADSKQ